MIVAKKSYSPVNYGGYDNYAYDYKRYEEREAPREDKIKVNKERHKERVKKQLKMVTMVILMLCVGIAIVGRYAIVTNLNYQSIVLKDKISENQKIIEDLKLELMKYGDIKQIEEYATSQGNMIRPDTANIVHIDGTKIAQNQSVDVANEKTEKVSFLGRIISFFN